MVEIVDNFLKKEDFEKLKEVVFDEKFLWNWLDSVAYHKDSPDFHEDKNICVILFTFFIKTQHLCHHCINFLCLY